MFSLGQLSHKKRKLLLQSLEDLDRRWDEEACLLRVLEDGVEEHRTRKTAFYALALLIRQGPGDVERADRAIRAILALQLLCPGEIWHGTFATALESAPPVRAPFDVACLTPEARWQADVVWTRLLPAFQRRVRRDPALRSREEELETMLSAALEDVYPVVWKTYDPNWREFIFCTFALILEEFDSLLPAETVEAMERAAREGLKGARFRTESDLTPLNTNVRVMHVAFFDAFARRFRDEALTRYAEEYAARFTEEYLRYHAVAEFNSPTYNGVVLSYTGLLRTRGGSPAVRRMGEVLETGLWEDLADFYNPALGALCGPFSRAYGMGIDGTALPMLMYLGMEEIPAEQTPPFGAETESACILCCSEPAIPDAVKRCLLASRGERRVTRQFRELAERGKPGENHSLCTATAWITDRLMLGAISGSTNTSHQLHSAMIHWRNTLGGVSGIRLRRRTGDGRLIHLRTVYLDMTAEPGHLSGEVRNETTAPILCHLEVESPEAAAGSYEAEEWRVDGLTCRVEAGKESPDGGVQPVYAEIDVRQPDQVWLAYPLDPGETLRLSLRCFVGQEG